VVEVVRTHITQVISAPAVKGSHRPFICSPSNRSAEAPRERTPSRTGNAATRLLPEAGNLAAGGVGTSERWTHL